MRKDYTGTRDLTGTCWKDARGRYYKVLGNRGGNHHYWEIESSMGGETWASTGWLQDQLEITEGEFNLRVIK